ncbi:MAG: NAD(P)/FAD-dependent oxidoreductase, partial [Alphaproteobacteria bacterium]
MAGLDSIVIVGAAQAGGRAAQALRANGFDGRLVLIGDERWLPYERPPLSKQLLMGDGGLEKVQLHDQKFYESKAIELWQGERVAAIDAKARQIRVAGRSIGYDRLLLATGARPRALGLPGEGLAGVRYLRTLDDSDSIRSALVPGARVVVVGGGFIGLEVAASARTRGCTVTVIELADRLMGRAVAREVSAYYEELHRAKGVEIRLGARPSRIEGAGRAERIVLADGGAVAADLVVIGVGIVPNVELAAEAGLAVDNGVVVDEFGRASDPHIHAAGDVANQPSPFLGRRVRLESYENAQNQAMAVARNMLGHEAAYHDRLWNWTDQYHVNLQILGLPREWDSLAWRGDRASGTFTVFYMLGGRIVAVNTV